MSVWRRAGREDRIVVVDRRDVDRHGLLGRVGSIADFNRQRGHECSILVVQVEHRGIGNGELTIRIDREAVVRIPANDAVAERVAWQIGVGRGRRCPPRCHPAEFSAIVSVWRSAGREDRAVVVHRRNVHRHRRSGG